MKCKNLSIALKKTSFHGTCSMLLGMKKYTGTVTSRELGVIIIK